MTSVLVVRVPAGLRGLLRGRPAEVTCPVAGDQTLGHVIRSLNIPLTEVARLVRDGQPASPQDRADAPGVIELVCWDPEVTGPQPTPTDPPRFLLDVHLGTLARWLRMLGVDTAYDNAADDPELAAGSVREERVLLTRDRGLLHRSVVRHGAYVHALAPQQQVREVLTRFAITPRPWTRCTTCNAELVRVDKSEVDDELQAGTRDSYQHFARCGGCGQVFWQGAHARRLHAVMADLVAPASRTT